MLSKTSIIVFMCFIAYAFSQTYTRLTHTDCGSRNAKINRLSIEPMPIVQPGNGRISFSIESNDNIRGVIKADINIVRTVSGIKLPVRCYVVEGEQVGSCSYPDLCNLFKRIIPYEQCPANLAQHGIDCNCPVNINKRSLDIDMDVAIPKAPEYASWLSTGDFDVKLNATVGNLAACYNLKFSVKAAGRP